jgi:hypothetical protein
MAAGLVGTAEFVGPWVQVLMTKLLLLTPSDLQVCVAGLVCMFWLAVSGDAN